MKRKVIGILMLGCMLCFVACNKSQTSEMQQENDKVNEYSSEANYPSAIHPDTLREPHPTIMHEYLENEKKAMEQLNRLYAYFSEETEKEGEIMYADYCGGVYLNEECNLVVCVTRDYDLNSGLIEKYTENDDIIIQVVDYPYYALEEEMEYISEQYKRLEEAFALGTEKEVCGSIGVARVKNLMESTSGWGLSETANRVIVGIRDLDDEKIKTFRSVISDKGIVDFEVGGYFSYS